jgi:hypothetical protein
VEGRRDETGVRRVATAELSCFERTCIWWWGEEEEERGDEPNMCEKDDCIYPAEIATGQV